MATIFKKREGKFEENPGRTDDFRLMSDISIPGSGLKPQNLNFDLRQLNPGEFSSHYHYHNFAEELFMIISGTATLRTPEGLQIVESGDLVFFEKGETGAHQLYNHTGESCVFLDIRTYIGYDECGYPDADKILYLPSMTIFDKNAGKPYVFKGQENIREIWKNLKNK